MMNTLHPDSKVDVISEEMYQAMCTCGMSEPVSLAAADLTKSFVHERRRGVFYVDYGHHCSAMTLLLAWQHGLVRTGQILRKLKIDSHTAAEAWLENTPGAAFRSSVGRSIQVASLMNLSIAERRLFKNVQSW